MDCGAREEDETLGPRQEGLANMIMIGHFRKMRLLHKITDLLCCQEHPAHSRLTKCIYIHEHRPAYGMLGKRPQERKG